MASSGTRLENGTTGQEHLVLVADEDLGLARSLQILLEDEGRYRVEVAGSTAEAMAQLLEHPDVALVIGDLDLPSHHGLRLHDVLPEHQITVPLVLMTAHPSATASARAAADGACCLMTKPIDPDELLHRVEELLVQPGPSSLPWRSP